jgi:hypothetical protein
MPLHFIFWFSTAGLIRVKRMCSTVETTKQRLGDLRHHLKRRGYNDNVIESGFSRASEIDRNDLLVCVLQLETPLATLVTTWFTLADRQ